MRKIKIFVICISIFCLSACNKNESDEKNTVSSSEIAGSENTSITPTGYAQGDAQQIFIKYDGNLYVYDDSGMINRKEEDLERIYPKHTIREKIVHNSNEEPTENLHSAHLNEGDIVLVNPDNKDEILVYDSGRILKMKKCSN